MGDIPLVHGHFEYDYIILHKENMRQLEEQVSINLRNGWECVGGIAFQPYEKIYKDGSSFTYYTYAQAMQRKELHD